MCEDLLGAGFKDLEKYMQSQGFVKSKLRRIYGIKDRIYGSKQL